jgi:hypothetical protein
LSRRIALQATKIALALVLLVLAVPASHASFDALDVPGYYLKEDQGTWAAYYRSHARVRLGPEQRLANGVSWRLHIDVGTRLAMPRITWMPDARRMRTANALLDMAQGGAMLVSRAAGRELDEEQTRLRLDGKPIFQYGKPVVQTDVGLTYATPNLVSFVDLGYVVHEEGNATWRIIRGVTFDLAVRRVFGIEACPDSDIPYTGLQYTVATQGVREPLNYLFQFGPLRVCNRQAYEKFVELLKRRAILVAEQAAGSKDPVVRACSEKPNVEQHIDKDQEIVLYLTFKGLAVHNTEYWPNASRSYCTLARSPVNPVILPYRELEPFMVPGPWRDELLKLK